jgi:hypothetical protein
MARIKKTFKHLVIFLSLFMFYFMFIAQNVEHEETETNNLPDIIPTFKPNIDNKLTKVDKFFPNTNGTIGKTNSNSYFFNMTSPDRLNRLFDIILEKEKKIEHTLRQLEILVFQDLINENQQALPSSFKSYNREIKDFLQVFDKKIRVTSKFLEYLNSQSDFHSFQNPRKNILKRKINNVGILFIFYLLLKILVYLSFVLCTFRKKKCLL